MAYVINTLEVGGAERLLVELTRRLDRSRVAPHVFTVFGGGRLESELRQAGVPVTVLHKRLRFGVDVILPLAGAFRHGSVQIVHTHLPGADLYGTVAAILAGVPVIVTTQHSVLAWSENALARRLRARLQHRINATVAVSRFVAEHLQAQGIPPQRVRLIYNGIDPPRTPPPSLDGLRRAAMVARLDHPKGHAVALQALAMLRARGVGLSLEVIGDGSLRDELTRMARNLRLYGVTFHGERPDVDRLLQDIDLVLLPSLVEGLPLSLLEAMAAGALVIASAVGGIPEVITDGVDGILVPPGDPAALAGAIERAVRSPEDVARMRTAAQERIRAAFDIRATVRAHESLYETLWQAAHDRH